MGNSGWFIAGFVAALVVVWVCRFVAVLLLAVSGKIE
jgi:hypothetical protein